MLTTRLSRLDTNKPKLSEVNAVNNDMVNNITNRNHSRG